MTNEKQAYRRARPRSSSEGCEVCEMLRCKRGVVACAGWRRPLVSALKRPREGQALCLDRKKLASPLSSSEVAAHRRLGVSPAMAGGSAFRYNVCVI